MKANNEMDIIQEAKEWLTHKDDCGNYAKKLGVDYKDHSIEYKLISCLVDRLEWQPIETAPKDGTYILGYYIGGNHIFNNSCAGKQNCKVIYWDKDMDVGSYHPWQTFGPAAYMERDISHWMPLPLPPVGDK